LDINMPLYTFKNKKTEEEFDEYMSYDNLDNYLRTNKDLEQVFKINIFRYSDNNGTKDQFTEWAKDSSVSGNGEFKPYGKARNDEDRRKDDKEKN